MAQIFTFIILFINFSYADQLDKLINIAIENNPILKSYENLILAKENRSQYKLSFPNPLVGFAIQSVELEYPFPRSSNPMSGFAFFVSQKYVLWRKRNLDSQIAESLAEKIKIERELFKKRLVRALKEHFYDYQYSFMLEDLSLSIKREIEDLMEVSEEHYIYGKINLSDLVFLNVELSRIEEEIVKAKKLRLESLAKIETLVGRDITLKREKLNMTDFPTNFSPERSIYTKVVKEDIKVLKKEEERLKVEHLPDIYFSGAYLLRPDISDLITLKLGLTIPLWYERKEKLMVMEKREEIRAKILLLEGVKLEIKGKYKALKAVYEYLRETIELVRKEIKDKKKEIESLNIAFAYEKEDFRDVLRAYRELWDLRLKEIKILIELLKVSARAEELL